MALVTNTEVGLEESNFYNHHRFDNYTAWLDQQVRNKNRYQGKPQGFGYPIPRPPAPDKDEPEFVVQEAGFTSGKLLNRRYVQLKSSFPLEPMRTDPYHYPNGLRVSEDMHYEDRRARSQHIDPGRRKELPRDRGLREAVPDELVKNTINPPATKMQIDPKLLGIKFDRDIRPTSDTVHELNVDLSCVDMPPRERKQMSRTHVGHSGGRKGREWSWCLGGRKDPPKPSVPEGLAKSASLPAVLGGTSHLAHSIGAVPSAFHGTGGTTKFQTGKWDGRMRGGRFAREGYAGSFPNNEIRA